MDRRKFVKDSALLLSAIASGSTAIGANAIGTNTAATKNANASLESKKVIAVEEAFATEEILNEWRTILKSDEIAKIDPGFKTLYGPLLAGSNSSPLLQRLLDVESSRLENMAANGISHQVLSMTAPGVQVFDAEKGTKIAEESNTYLAEKIAKNPKHFTGLAAVAPQNPKAAAKEIERSVNKLGMRGIILNSHTHGEYLDEEKYYPIFEAAEANGVPIFLHPRTPSPQMIEPFLDYGLIGPGWGFAAETSLHAMRLILSGVFDRFENLQIVLGHLGEGVPFWLDRADSRIKLSAKFDRTRRVGKLKHLPSEYYNQNFYTATSGMNFTKPLNYLKNSVPEDRVLFAIDYPYESTVEAMEGVKSAGLGSHYMDALMYSNAEKLFSINI